MSKTYNAEGTRVIVTWQEILPKDKESLPDKAVIFFPGWPVRATVEMTRKMGESIANNSKVRTYVVYTTSEHITPNPVYQEAQAVCQFIAEKEMKHITLVGYSQGGIKAIDTIALLQAMNPHIHIEGLILINSVGLNEIDSWKSIRRHIVDLLFKTLLVILRESARRPSLRMKFMSLIENIVLSLHAARDFFLSIWIEMRTFHQSFFSRFKNELNESTKRSLYLEQVRVPIVLIQGAKDRIFGNDRIVAQARAKTTQDQPQDANLTEALPTHCKDAEEQILPEDLFPRSPYVRMVKVEKFGSHILPIFRSNSIARASFYLLQKYQRRVGSDNM